MNRTEGIYFALGLLKGYCDSGKDYKTVNLIDVFNDQVYSDYCLGTSEAYNEIILWYKYDDHDNRRRVIEITREFNVRQIATLLLQALAYEIEK